MTRMNIIVPIETTNLVQNPSIETNTTGYTAVGAGTALAQNSDYQRRGVYSLRVTPDSGVEDGVYYTVSAVATNTNHAYSFDFRGVDGVPYQAYLYDIGISQILGTPQTFTGDGEWHRYSDVVQTSTGAVVRLYIIKNNSASTGAFYIDGVQLEQQDIVTTYCDGDQMGNITPLPGNEPAYRWNGAKHASTSTRSAKTTAGGQILDLEALGTVSNVRIGGVEGVGIPPQRHNVQDFALLDGAQLQSVKTEPRTIQIEMRTDASGSDPNPATYTARDQLTQKIIHDRVAPLQPVILEWTDTGHRIKAYYEGGMEAVWDSNASPGGCAYETFALRFIAYDPFWFEDGQEGYLLDNTDDIWSGSDSTRLVVRNNGYWNDHGIYLDSGASQGTIYVIEPDISNPNLIWIGGDFTTIGGVAYNYAVQYNSVTETYSAVGTGFNDIVRAIVSHPNGKVYFGGDFTTAGGGAVGYIAEYDPDAGTFSAMNSGFDDYVTALALDRENGYLFAAGNFTSAQGGLVDCYHAARIQLVFNIYAALGTDPTDGTTQVSQTIAQGLDGYIYYGATARDGTSAAYFAAWDISNSAWITTVDIGLDDVPNDMVVADNGDIFLGGDFTETDPSGTDLNYLARWTGSQMLPLGDGVASGLGSTSVESIALDLNGILHIVGNFRVVSTFDVVRGYTLWNGSEFLTVDIDNVQSEYAMIAQIDAFNNIYFAFRTADPEAAAITTATNTGTAQGWPIIQLDNSANSVSFGTVQWIENQTTGDRIYANLTLLGGEIVTLNLNPQFKEITSNFGANRSQYFLASSNLATFSVLPGSNRIAAFCTGITDLVIKLYWDIRHTSADGGASS